MFDCLANVSTHVHFTCFKDIVKNLYSFISNIFCQLSVRTDMGEYICKIVFNAGIEDEYRVFVGGNIYDNIFSFLHRK